MWTRALAALACAASACVPTVEGPPDDTRGIVAAVVVRVVTATGEVLEARVIEPYPSSERMVLVTSTAAPAVLLGYPQPLAAYGLQVTETGRLQLDPQGVPLPPPSLWLELDAAGEREVDVATQWPAALAAVRVPPRDCLAVEEVEDSRIRIEGPENLSFAAALDEARTLVVFDRGLLALRPRVEVRTPTATVPLPFPLLAISPTPRGFVEDDGSAWLIVHVATSTHPEDRGVPTMCHFRAGAPYAPPDCAPALGAYQIIDRIDGRRSADGTLEMIAISADSVLRHWRGDAHDRGEWTMVRASDVRPSPECVRGSSFVVFDGPGTGVMAFRGGELERFDVATRDRTPVFEAPSGQIQTHCRAVYARHPLGPELLVRMAEVPDSPIVPRPQLWWRATASAAWQLHPDQDSIDLGSLTVLGETVLAPSAGLDVAVLAVDPLRLDVHPRVCRSRPVFNDAHHVTYVGGDQVLIAGNFPLATLAHAAIARWRVVPIER